MWGCCEVEFIRSWVSAIAAVTMMMAVVSVLTPKNSAGRAVMLCGSIIMMVVLVSPIKKLDVSALSGYGARFQKEIEFRAEQVSRQNEKLRKDIIEENTRAYILQRAESMGISCDLDIECYDDVPYTAVVSVKNKDVVPAVSMLLERDVGIPSARQTFKIEG